MNFPPLNSLPPAVPDPARRGWRISLGLRLALIVAAVATLCASSFLILNHYFPDALTVNAVLAAVLSFSAGLVLLRWQMQPVWAIFRAMSGTVLSYQDRDFSFGLHWSRRDELADLVDAHNQLGQVLREQRLDLVQRELLLDSMLQNTPVAMLLIGERGFVVFSNSTARQLLHHGRKLEGMSLETILQQVSPSLREAMEQSGDGLFTVGASTSEEGGGEDEIYHLSRRVFVLNGSEHRLFLIRHLTVELRRQEVQTWKKVIRVISHELNNSLAPVASLAHSAGELVSRAQYERLPEIMRTIEERAQHLESFINGYARFAKLPAPRYETVQWSGFICGLQAQVPFQVQGKLPELAAQFDSAQMEQALLNLLKNAVESGAPSESIMLEVKSMFEAVRIEVSDAGSGMSETVMANALVPFYSTKRHGTGLGLALAREIIEAHGGRIMLNNRESGGLTVSLILPERVTISS